VKRIAAFVVAVIVLITPTEIRGATGDAHEQSLLALCRVWNAVRFSHPFLDRESNEAWDDALLAAIPLVERDPTALRGTVRTMLETLNDPITAPFDDRLAGAVAVPSGERRNGVNIVHLNGYPDPANLVAWQSALAAAIRSDRTDRGLVVDLRLPGSASYEQLAGMESAWTALQFASTVIGEPIRTLPVARRYMIGFPPEVGMTSGYYVVGREMTSDAKVIRPAKGARALPVAFLIDRSALVSDDALALERSQLATIVSTDGTPGILPGDGGFFNASDTLRIFLRSTGPIDMPTVRRGTFDTALEALNAPIVRSPIASVDSIPIQQRYSATTLPDEAHRVLAAFRMWGAIVYAFPYKSLMHDDWDAALEHALPELRNADTSLAYELSLLRMYAHIHDSHGYIRAPAVAAEYAATPPFVAREVDGRPTIVRVDSTVAKRDGFAVGDVIESIDNESVTDRKARLRSLIAASTEQSLQETLDTGIGRPTILAGPRGSIAIVGVRSANGRRHIVRVERVVPKSLTLYQRTRPVIDVLPGNIGYADLERLNVGDVDGMIARFASTRAIVFDLRGYPRGTAWAIAPHFIKAAVRGALFRTPVRRTPADERGEHLQYVDETRDFYQLIDSKPPLLQKPVVIVVDSRAISQSEHTALYLAASAHARFVGQPTMGANGDVTGFALPGGITANFSGQAVLHPDGTPLQRVGIVPDVLIAPTLGGVRSGEDELLLGGIREALRLAHADPAATKRALDAERRAEVADMVAQNQPPILARPAQLSADARPLPDTFEVRGAGYTAQHDDASRHRDGHTIRINRSATGPFAEFGTYVVSIPIAEYRGKRVRISGVLRSKDATSGAFWARVDGPARELEAFDNMNDRPLVGTHDWTPFSIVLDVPMKAEQLVSGLLLVGEGTLWADDLTIDTVDQTVKPTGGY